MLRGALAPDRAADAAELVKRGRNPSTALLESGAPADATLRALATVAGIPAAPPRAQWQPGMRSQLEVDEATWRRMSAVPVGFEGTRPLVAFADLAAIGSGESLRIPDHVACVALEADVLEALASPPQPVPQLAVSFLAPPSAVERSLRIGPSAFRPGTPAQGAGAMEAFAPLAPPAGFSANDTLPRGGQIGTGTVCGRYVLGRQVGQGGMATVYLATATDGQAPHQVAIKVLHDHLLRSSGGETLRQRFKREVEAMRRLHHPNVVECLDAGRVGDSEYFATEYLAGGSLRQLLDVTGKLPPSLALSFFDELLEALGHAHSQGIIHRDLKPENLLLGGDGAFKIADFGIARIVEGTELTATGGMMGTPAYMSPEQAMGRPLDGRSDLFSLGIIFYELLTGKNPLDADSIGATVANVVAGRIVPVGEVEPAVPFLLDHVLTRLLALRPDDRFASAQAVAKALEPLRERARPFRELLPALVARKGGILETAVTREAELYLASARRERAAAPGQQLRLRAAHAAFRATTLVPDHPEARSMLAALGAGGPLSFSRSATPSLFAQEEALSSLKLPARIGAYRAVAQAYLDEGNPLFAARFARRGVLAAGLDQPSLAILVRVLPEDEVDAVRSLPARLGEELPHPTVEARPASPVPAAVVPARAVAPPAPARPVPVAPARPSTAERPRPARRSALVLSLGALAALAAALFAVRGCP